MKQGKPIFTATVLLLGLMLLTGSALGKAVFIPVSGEDAVTVTSPGESWIDDDGITHIRGLTATTITSGTDDNGVAISGAGNYQANVNLNYATGDGDMSVWGTMTMTYGDLVGSWRTRFVSTVTGFVHDGTFNCPRGFGDLSGWHFRGTWTGIYGSTLPNLFDGYFHIPGQGNKAAGSESETWSSVKDLFQ